MRYLVVLLVALLLPACGPKEPAVAPGFHLSVAGQPKDYSVGSATAWATVGEDAATPTLSMTVQGTGLTLVATLPPDARLDERVEWSRTKGQDLVVAPRGSEPYDEVSSSVDNIAVTGGKLHVDEVVGDQVQGSAFLETAGGPIQGTFRFTGASQLGD